MCLESIKESYCIIYKYYHPHQIWILILFQRQGKAATRGVRGVSDFVRVDTLQQSGRCHGQGEDEGVMASGSSSMGSRMSLNSSMGVGKSWKKHNNRNKKEKLRRVHRDLDIWFDLFFFKSWCNPFIGSRQIDDVLHFVVSIVDIVCEYYNYTICKIKCSSAKLKLKR